MNVVVLAGGESGERQVSIDSGKAVAAALERLGHKVAVRDPLPEGGRNGESLAPGPVWLLRSDTILRSDVVYIALHGGTGENGKIQCLLEMAGVTYTGSDMAASAMAMDKTATKRLLVSDGIATPAWMLVQRFIDPVSPKLVDEIDRRFEYPCIVKPNDGGSTIGLTKVEASNQIEEAVMLAAEETGNVLIEQYIAGRELTVSVLDGEALPVVEIRPESGLYDYEAKYTKGKSNYICPAEIDETIASRIRNEAVRAYHMIGASGLVRVDFILEPNGKTWCLEVNTLPGMTELSLAPMAAAQIGMDFDTLVARIVESALNKYKR